MSIFNFEGKDVFYEFDGSPNNPPLLILNGIMMSTRSWQPFMATLTEHFHVLRVDFLDQGQSSRMDGINYTQNLQIKLLKGLLNHLKIGTINIVGISYGGEVALGFACVHQEYVNRLLLFNTTAYTNEWLKDIGDGWVKAGQTRDGGLYYKVTIPSIYSSEFYSDHIEWMKNREKILIPVFSNPVFLDAMERLTRSAEPYDVRESLKNLELPVMIISAEQDVLTPTIEQEYLYKNIKNSLWLKIPDVGHASMYENPLVFTSLITGFFLVKDLKYNV